jgi:hypothetical protein
MIIHEYLSHTVLKFIIFTEAWRQKIIDHQLYLKTCVAKHRVLQQT